MTTRRTLLLTVLFSFTLPYKLRSGEKLDPQKARKRLRQARQHAARGEFEKMRQQAERARKSDPTNAESYAFLGSYELRMRRLDQAEQLLQSSIERDPNLGIARTYLGNVFFERGDRDRALDEWTVGARLDPTDPEALCSLAVGLLTIDQVSEAKRNYEKALLRDRRYYDPEFLVDRKKGAAWGEAKADILKPLMQTVRKPAYPY